MPALRPEPASAHGCRRKESHDRRKNPECEELSSLVSCNLGGSARRQPRGCSGSDATCPVGWIYTHAKKCPAWTGPRHRLKKDLRHEPVTSGAESVCQMSQPHARVFQRWRFDRILLGLDHDPTGVSNLSQQAREAVEVDEAVTRHRKNPVQQRGRETGVALTYALEDFRPHILAMDQIDAIGVAPRKRQHVGS